MTFQLGAASDASELVFGLFDADNRAPNLAPLTSSHWDDLSATPLQLDLYADPNGDGTGVNGNGLDSASLIAQWTGAGAPSTPVGSTVVSFADNGWTDLSSSVNSGPLARPVGCSTCAYRYVLRVSAADQSVASTGSNVFKIRTGGVVSLQPQTFAFLAAMQSPGLNPNDATIVYPNWPNPAGAAPTAAQVAGSTYDGTWLFGFNVPANTPVEMWDGDVDFGNADCTREDTDDVDSDYRYNPSTLVWDLLAAGLRKPVFAGTSVASQGVAVGPTQSCGPTTGATNDDTPNIRFRRLPTYLAPSGVAYELVDPNGVSYRNIDPSGNLEWEHFAVWPAASLPDPGSIPGPFPYKIPSPSSNMPEDASLNRRAADYAAASMPGGTYLVRLDGQDMANLSFWRFGYPALGQDPDGSPTPVDAFYTLKGNVFSDLNHNGLIDGETSFAGIQLQLLDQNGVALKNTVGTTWTTLTDANGNYSFRVSAGAYQVHVVTAPAGGFLPTMPTTVSATVGGAVLTLTNNFGYRRPPTAVNDGVFTVNRGATLTVTPSGVLANDTDPEPAVVLSVASFTNPSHGTVVLNANGSFTYVPTAGYVGADTFTYVANDTFANSNVATVSINVVNNAPVAVDDSYSTNENVTLTVGQPGVLVNDSDPDGDAISLQLISAPSHGALTINTDGSFQYTSTTGFVGADTFTYKVNDGLLDSQIATVTINVVGHPPVAVDDSASTLLSTPVIVVVLSNDSDPDNDSISVTGATNPSNGTITVNGNGTITYTPNSGFAGVDTFTYTITDGHGGTSTARVTITVLKLPVVVHVPDVTVPYDGGPHPTTCSVTAADHASLTGTLTYAPALSSAAGAYVATCNFAGDGGHDSGTSTGTVIINKAPLTITADTKSKVYDGAVYAPFSATYSAFVPGESASNLTGTLSYSGAATTAVDTAVYTNGIIPGGQTSTNYAITYVPATLTITIADAPVVHVTGGTHTYDGHEFPGACTVNGVAGGHLTYTPGGATAPTNAGTYTVDCDVPADLNHKAGHDGPATITIDPAPLTITADAKSKVYDGTVYAPFTATYSAFVPGESASNLTGTLSYTGAATSAVDTGIYTNGIIPGGQTSTNYAITYVPATLTITIADAPVVHVTGGTHTYDGHEFPGNCTVNGVAGGHLTYTAGGASAPINAGSYTVVCDVPADLNHKAGHDGPATITISPAPLTITADAKSKVYDGAVYAPFTATFSAFVAGESVENLTGTLSYTGAATTAVDTAVYTNGIIPGGLTSTNYAISYVPATLTITIAEAPVVHVTGGTHTYDGHEFPGNCTVNGVAGGTLTYTVGGATAPTNAGTYTVVCDVPADLNHKAGHDGPATITINPAPLTITADAKSKVYDGTVYAPFTATFSAFVAGESVENLTGTLGYTGAATSAVDTGVYTNGIIPGGLTSTNYAITYVPATLTITIAEAPVVHVTGGTHTYDGHEFPGACTVNGEAGGMLTYTAGGATAPTNAGTYTVVCDVPADLNHKAGHDGPATITINPAPLTITADAKSKVYDGTVYAPFTATFSAFVAGESVENLTGTLGYTGAATSAVNSGVYMNAIVPGGLTSTNYAITYAPGTLTITKQPLTVVANDKSRVYGTANPALDGTLTGVVSGDGITASYSTGATVSTVVGVYSTSPNNIVATLNDPNGRLGNYSVTNTPGTLTITKASVVVTAKDKTKMVGDPDPVFDFTYGPFPGPDTTVTSAPTCGVAAAHTAAGTYQIACSGASDDNYTFTYVPGTLTIAAPVCAPGAFTTFTQGGWGANPAGNNPGALLASKFASVYPGGFVQIGGGKTLKFTTASAIAAFLPQGGSPAALSASATNATSSSAGVFAGQVLALQLNVDFSAAGVTKPGLGNLVILSGPLAGKTVAQVLALANLAIGGGTLPSGVTLGDLNTAADAINNNYDNGTSNCGYLADTACPLPPAMTLTKSVNKSMANPGDQLVYTLSYKNTGGSSATGVVIADVIPAHTTFVSTTGGGVNASGTVTWTLASVSAGSTGSVTLTVKLDTTLPNGTTTISNSATIKSIEKPTPVPTPTVTTTVTVVAQCVILSASNDEYSTNKGHSITILAPAILGNDVDASHRPLTVAQVNGSTSKVGVSTATAHGSVKVNADGSFTYTPASGFSGTDTFTYRAKVADGTLSNVATVTINVIAHFDGDGCDHDRNRSGHRDGDNCEHDRIVDNHYAGDGCDHDRRRNGHRDGDNCAHDRDVRSSHTHYDGDRCDHDRDRNGHHDGDGCAHDRQTHRHYDGDGCDHDRDRSGHHDGDGCEHDRQTYHHNDGDGCDHDRDRSGHYAGDDCDHDRDQHHHRDGDDCDHDRHVNGHYDGDRCGHDREHHSDDDHDSDGQVCNNPPVAANNAYTTAKNTALTVAANGVLGNDADLDGGALTAVLVSNGGHGAVTLNANGGFTYTPANGFVGTDSFTYKAKDPSGALSNVATVTITIVSPAPHADNDSYRTQNGTTLTISAPGINGNDDGTGSMTAQLVSSTSHGTLTLSANGSFTYKPASGFAGQDSFTYKVKDATGNWSNVATVTIDVDQCPDAHDHSYTPRKNKSQDGNVLDDCDNPHQRRLTAVKDADVAHGAVQWHSDGTFTYTPDKNFTGTDSFTFHCVDSEGNRSKVQTVRFTVK